MILNISGFNSCHFSNVFKDIFTFISSLKNEYLITTIEKKIFIQIIFISSKERYSVFIILLLLNLEFRF